MVSCRRGAHPHPWQVGIQFQVRPGRPVLQPAQHQMLHRVEAERPSLMASLTA